MYKITFLILFLTMIVSCSNKQSVNFKHGTFVVSMDGNETTIIERNEDFQLEYSIDNAEKELFTIKWLSEYKYILEDFETDDSNSLPPLIVTIDSIVKKTYYQTSYIEGIDLIVKSRITKVDNKVSKEFMDIVAKIDYN